MAVIIQSGRAITLKWSVMTCTRHEKPGSVEAKKIYLLCPSWVTAAFERRTLRDSSVPKWDGLFIRRTSCLRHRLFPPLRCHAPVAQQPAATENSWVFIFYYCPSMLYLCFIFFPSVLPASQVQMSISNKTVLHYTVVASDFSLLKESWWRMGFPFSRRRWFDPEVIGVIRHLCDGSIVKIASTSQNSVYRPSSSNVCSRLSILSESDAPKCHLDVRHPDIHLKQQGFVLTLCLLQWNWCHC